MSCNNPDRHMGFYDVCGTCEGCTAPQRVEAIERMVGTALIQDSTLDEWTLRQRAASFYDKGRVRTPKKPVRREAAP